MAERFDDLDLYSTSQTNSRTKVDFFTGELLDRGLPCGYGSPLVAYVIAGKGYLTRGNCNHWDCPRCGVLRAKHEYRRIVEGCEKIGEEHKLYFWTLTCRGREIPLKLAEEQYYAWTNRLLTNARAKSKRAGMFWVYVQVTERQKKTRAHPHSHLITTFLPADSVPTSDDRGNAHLVSKWFTSANLSAGLGAQHKITEVRSTAAVSRYVAKYLFKDSFADKFPKDWKRVRYSQNFPKLARAQPQFSIQLSNSSDWQQLDRQSAWFECESVEMFAMASKHCHKVTKPVILPNNVHVAT